MKKSARKKISDDSIRLSHKEMQSMAVYAFRYTLGRMTYAVSEMAEFLTKHWHHFDLNTQILIRKEILKAKAEHRLGAQIHQKEWESILALGMKEPVIHG